MLLGAGKRLDPQKIEVEHIPSDLISIKADISSELRKIVRGRFPSSKNEGERESNDSSSKHSRNFYHAGTRINENILS